MHKKSRFILAVLATTVLLSCNSQKSSSFHHHDGTTNHVHDIESSDNQRDIYFGNYTLNETRYGTKTEVIVVGDIRTMVTNALPNHKTGEYPRKGNPNSISAQNRTYTFPVHPKYTGIPQWIREPGVSLNGVKFEPGTAEVVVCDTGENYRVEAFQDVIDLGLDFNNAHVQPTGAYHYHGSPTSVIEIFDTGEDLVHIGFAHDGFPMYYSKSGKYKSSFKAIEGNREGEDCTYETPRQSIDVAVGGHHDGTFTSDFEYVEGYGDLDECNGITIDGKYMYLVTNEFPYVSRCLMGEVTQAERQGPGRQQRERLSVSQIFERMDTDKDGKLSAHEVKGPLINNFSTIDDNGDGFVTKEEMSNAPRPQRNERN